MHLKATLIVDDVRFETRGTTTFVGVHGERVRGIGINETIAFPTLSFVTIVTGLMGIDTLHYRHRLRSLDNAAMETGREVMQEQSRDATYDEHMLLFGNSPMRFPAAGRYELEVEVIAKGQREVFTYPFSVELAAL